MYFTAAIVGIFFVISVFVTIFQCRPVQSAWDFTTLQDKCINYIDFLYVAGAVGLATDLIITLLPIPLFWKLKLPKKQKIILTALFGIGMV